MPRYFFNTIDGRRIPDDEGTDLPDLSAVRAEATRVMGELLKEQPEDLWAHGRLTLEVTDEGGAGVLVLAVSLEAQVAA
jgi:hypothetical protein